MRNLKAPSPLQLVRLCSAAMFASVCIAFVTSGGATPPAFAAAQRANLSSLAQQTGLPGARVEPTSPADPQEVERTIKRQIAEKQRVLVLQLTNGKYIAVKADGIKTASGNRVTIKRSTTVTEAKMHSEQAPDDTAVYEFLSSVFNEFNRNGLSGAKTTFGEDHDVDVRRVLSPVAPTQSTPRSAANSGVEPVPAAQSQDLEQQVKKAIAEKWDTLAVQLPGGSYAALDPSAIKSVSGSRISLRGGTALSEAGVVNGEKADDARVYDFLRFLASYSASYGGFTYTVPKDMTGLRHALSKDEELNVLHILVPASESLSAADSGRKWEKVKVAQYDWRGQPEIVVYRDSLKLGAERKYDVRVAALENAGATGLSPHLEGTLLPFFGSPRDASVEGQGKRVLEVNARVNAFGLSAVVVSVNARDRDTGEIVFRARGWGYLGKDEQKDLLFLARGSSVPTEYK